MSAVEYIAGTTLTATTTSVTFSNIPNTYADLFVTVVWGVSANSSATRMQYNGDTAANYSNTSMTGTGSAAASGRESGQTSIRCFGVNVGPVSTSLQMGTIHIAQYSNTSVFKTNISVYAGAASEVSAVVGLWRSTAAISSLTLLDVYGYLYSVGSTFSLWGVK